MTTSPTTPITWQHIKNAYTYEEYRQMGRDLVSQGKTTGNVQSEKYIEYSKLNDHRMTRLDKQAVITEETKLALKSLTQPMIWVVLTELWCGDAAQNIPVLAKMEAESRGKIRLLLMLRDENPEVIDGYLTNGAKAIPKLVALADKTREELFTWGPRPVPAKQIMLDWRAAGSSPEVDYKKDIQYWYLRDNGQTLQREMVELVRTFVI